MNDPVELKEGDDSAVDALAAVVLIVVFVAVCVLWVSSQ